MLRPFASTPAWLLSLVGLLALSNSTLAGNGKPWTPTDPPNTPIGVARGIFPGRVVWVYDPAAVHWDGRTGHWWDAAASDQGHVDNMISQSIRGLTGAGRCGRLEGPLRFFQQVP